MIGYPVTNQITSPAMQTFALDFADSNVGFMHLYAEANPDPLGEYLLKGKEVSGTTRALLPEKFQRMAKTENAKIYGAAAVSGINENLYIARFAGPMTNRLEMFAMRGNEIVHLKTLAYRECSEGGCRQLDSYLTDLNGDGDLDLIQISRLQTKNGDRGVRTVTYTMDDNKRKWKKTRKLDVPTASIEFYDPKSTD